MCKYQIIKYFLLELRYKKSKNKLLKEDPVSEVK